MVIVFLLVVLLLYIKRNLASVVCTAASAARGATAHCVCAAPLVLSKLATAATHLFYSCICV